MQELIEKAKYGSREAFTELVLHFEKDLYKIAKTRLQSDDDISDAFQETVISAFKAIKNLKKNECFKTWLIKILINKCNSIYLQKKNGCEYFLDDIQVENEKVLIDDNVDTIMDNLEFNELIKPLSYDEKIVLTLYYAEGYTNKEIGQILNINENTIKARISRAKSKIKTRLKES